MNNNPLNTIKNYIKQQGSPKEMLLNFVQKNNSNPMVSNLIQMAKNGDSKGVEQFARNAFKEQGRDLDKELSQFKQFIKR